MDESFVVRRRYPRIPSENAVLVKRLGPEAVEGFAKTGSVGLGGCMFRSDESLGVGSYLDLLISVRGSVLKALGRVVYEVPKSDYEIEVGVEFAQISEHDREVLETLFQKTA